jgi:hypothetical protein
MPHPDDLPDNLKDLAYRNSVEITHARWNSDVSLLTKALGQYVTSASSASTEPVHATVSVQLPPPNAPAAESATPKGSKAPLIIAVAATAVVLIAIVAFVLHRSGSNPPAATGPEAHGARAALANNGQAAASGAIDGVWINPRATGRDELAKLDVSGTGHQLSVHAWGKCPGCDWGTQTTIFDGREASATWTLTQSAGGDQAGRIATVTMAPDGANLAVTVANTFANKPRNQRRAQFVRAQ